MSTRKKRRVFSREFKTDVVTLYKNGKPRKEIIAEYDLTPSAFDKWVQLYSGEETLNEDNKLSFEQREIKTLRIENEKLKAENDILKQAALIFGRMSK